MVNPVEREPIPLTWSSLVRLSAIARAAGRAAMVHYRTEVPVEYKADRSPVTAADHAAHRVILDDLRDWDPRIPIVSEEGTLPTEAEREAWTHFWLVDPLDGTKEFLSANGEFTVNIALIRRGEPVLGVIDAPALGLLYSGGPGIGAWKREGSQDPVRIYSRTTDGASPLVVAESRSHPSEDLETYLTTINVARRVQAGSSLKFCWLAEGKADVYPRFGPTMEWDVAAGDCIYRHSGTDGTRSSPLRYNKPGFRNGSFVLGPG